MFYIKILLKFFKKKVAYLKLTVRTSSYSSHTTILFYTVHLAWQVAMIPKPAIRSVMWFIKRLTPNDPYMGRTAPLTSKRCILYIYSTNIGTEYFKHALYSPFFFSSKWSLFHNANVFGSCIIHILYTACAEIKKE
jgi:hypothetical protein